LARDEEHQAEEARVWATRFIRGSGARGGEQRLWRGDAQ
jgi:hypothetical protein